MASFSPITYTYGTRTITLNCTQTKDATNNRSLITWTFTSASANNDLYATFETTIVINGSTVVSYPERLSGSTFPRGNGQASGSLYVSHGSDGNKTISVSVTGGVGTDSGTKSRTWVLDQISPGSQIPTITSAPNFTDVDNPTITYYNPGGNSVPYLMVRITDGEGTTLAAWRDVPKTGSSYTFNLTAGERTALKNVTPGASRTVQFAIEAKSGWRSTVNRTFTVSDTAANKPTASFTSVGVDNTGLPAAFSSYYIQGKSKVTASVSASAATGTTISSRGASVNGKNYSGSSITSDVLAVSGSVAINAYATDARGHTGTGDARTLTVYAYSAPRLKSVAGKSSIGCYRSDNSGTPSSVSTSVWLSARASFSSIDGHNTPTMKWRYKQTPSGSWSGWTTLTLTNNSYDALLTGTYPITNTYVIEVKVEDTIGESSTVSFTIPTDDVPLSLGAGGKSVGIGRYADTADDYTVKVGWETHFDDEVFLTADGADRSVTEVVKNVWFNFIEDVTANSTATIKTLGIIPATAGYYLITLMSSSNNDNEGSIYIVRYLSSNDTYRLTVIHEGTATQAPRITSTGVLKLNSSTSEYNIRALVFRFYTGT